MSVIQILDDADAAFRILGAELRTVLSATTMLADKPHRLNGRTSVQRVYVLTILHPVTALTVGLPRLYQSRPLRLKTFRFAVGAFIEIAPRNLRASHSDVGTGRVFDNR